MRSNFRFAFTVSLLDKQTVRITVPAGFSAEGLNAYLCGSRIGQANRGFQLVQFEEACYETGQAGYLDLINISNYPHLLDKLEQLTSDFFESVSPS